MSSFEKYANETYRKFDNSLTIHVTNSPSDLDWQNTPRDLILSIAKNKYLLKHRTKRSIGHVTVEINYTDEYGKKVHRFGGQGASDLSQFAKRLIKEGFGFSVLIGPEQKAQHELKDKPYVTIDGHFENPDDLVQELDYNIYKDDLNAFVTYKLPLDVCKKLVKYFDEYKDHFDKAKSDKNYPHRSATRYGFGADPLKFEGAGCATFVEAFYKLSGLEKHYRSFYQSVFVPSDYFGNPDGGHKVGLGKLLFSKLKLGEKKDHAVFVEFPSPTELFYKMKKVFESTEEIDGLKVLDKGHFGDSKAFYVVLDAQI